MRKFFIVLVVALFSTFAAAKEMISINVLDSQIKGQPVAGATITFEKNGVAVNGGITDSHGRLIIKDGIFGGVDDSSVKIIIRKTGYATLAVRGPFNGLTFALSREMKDIGGYRIVLSWNESPKDIDSHLVYGDSHIYWNNQNGVQGMLDVDDTDGFGPETITIKKSLNGNRYIYAVHDYTNKDESFSSKLSESGAKVLVYAGSTQIETFYIPQGKIGNLWVLFTISEYGDLIPINKFTTVHNLDEADSLLKNILRDSSILDKKINKDSAELNKHGEDAYHNGNIDESIKYYKIAVFVNERFSQAYSNMGLSYKKQNKLPEAIWANRRAISLAEGKNEKTVKAASFFNIAKIFEEGEKYQDALDNYQSAEKNKSSEVYQKGIKRMKEKLGINE
jgi:tetratricopeptide (TPR) repeat protein